MCFRPRSASVPKSRRRSSLLKSPPRIAATFDLSNEVEREVRATIERLHTGRRPLFRCHALRRVGSVVYEVAEWEPARRASRPAHFSVVEWSTDRVGLCWRDVPTLDAAREAFAAAVANPSPADSQE